MIKVVWSKNRVLVWELGELGFRCSCVSSPRGLAQTQRLPEFEFSSLQSMGLVICHVFSKLVSDTQFYDYNVNTWGRQSWYFISWTPWSFQLRVMQKVFLRNCLRIYYILAESNISVSEWRKQFGIQGLELGKWIPSVTRG